MLPVSKLNSTVFRIGQLIREKVIPVYDYRFLCILGCVLKRQQHGFGQAGRDEPDEGQHQEAHQDLHHHVFVRLGHQGGLKLP